MKRVPAELKKIRAAIMDKKSGVFDELVAAVRNYTIGFIAIPNSSTGKPQPCGTATLVAVGSACYFLTAMHVWKTLQKFTNIGVTLVPDFDQCFMIPTSVLIATGPQKAAAEDQGPDIVLLKIPVTKVGEIRARKSFYLLERTTKVPKVNVVSIEVPIFMGAPGEAATWRTRRDLNMVLQGLMANPRVREFTKGGYDYVDSKEYFGAHGFPKSYGGFSGGGVWKVYVYLDPETGERRERNILAGVAFYEFPPKRRYRVIRSHGLSSIRVVKGMLASPVCDSSGDCR